MSTSPFPALRRALLASAVVCLAAGIAWAATFSNQVTISSNTVYVSSKLTDDNPGKYTRTVSVTLADGTTESLSDKNMYTLGQVVEGTFKFSQPVSQVNFIKETFDP